MNQIDPQQLVPMGGGASEEVFSGPQGSTGPQGPTEPQPPNPQMETGQTLSLIHI